MPRQMLELRMPWLLCLAALSALAACDRDPATVPERSTPAFEVTESTEELASAGVDLTAAVNAFQTTTEAQAASSGQTILLYFADDPIGSAAVVASRLVATGQFTSSDIDLLYMPWTPPSLSVLSTYDCLLVWTNLSPPNAVAQGDRLQEYVDAGGRVILATYAYSPPGRPWEMQGGIMGSGYSPFVNSDATLVHFPRSLDFATALTGHPILSGVTDFTYGGNKYYSHVTLDGGATLVASDDDGVPLIGINAAANVIGFNLWPRAGHTSGVYRALANACGPGVITVEIDIKPGSDPNCFNNDGNGVIPVAILGSPDFDVTQIDPGTVALDGMTVGARGKANKLLAHIEDANGDGIDDLVVQIEDVDGSFSSGSATATLTGNLLDGTPFEGSDDICIVPAN